MNEDIAAAIAAALAPVAATVGESLVVEPWFVLNPAAPTIEIYPGDPFSEDLGFGDGASLFWTVRARIHTVEHLGAQSVLLALMEPSGDTSVEAALTADQTLGGVVGSLGVEGPSAYTEFFDQASQTRLLGVTWRVQVLT